MGRLLLPFHSALLLCLKSSKQCFTLQGIPTLALMSCRALPSIFLFFHLVIVKLSSVLLASVEFQPSRRYRAVNADWLLGCKFVNEVQCL